MSTYGIDSLGYGSYASDPYFMYYLQNAYGNKSDATQKKAETKSETATVPTVSTDNVIKEPKKEDKKSSNAGLWIAGAVGAAALIYAGRNGKTKPLCDGIKNLFGKGKTMVENKLKPSTKFHAIMGEDGKLTFIIPDKKVTLKGSEAENFAKKHGIDLKKLTTFRKDSKLTEYAFKFEDGGKMNTIYVKDGKIVDINNGTESVKYLLDSAKDEHVEFIKKLNAQISKIEKREKGGLKGLTDVKWTTQIGDDTITIAKADFNKKTPIKDLNLETLGRYSEDSNEVQAHLFNNPKLKNLYTSDTLKGGKLPEGMKVESFSYKFNHDGVDTLCHYKNGEIVGITENGKYYARGTDVCDAFLGRKSDTLKIIIEKIFKDNKIPKDVKAVLVAA